MKRALIFFLIPLIKISSCTNYASPSLNRSFTLNSNLIVNPNISTPTISPAYYHDYSMSQSGWATKGLYVQYIDACLSQQSTFYVCPTYKGVTCGEQFLDTDSYFSNEQYYQRLTLSAGLEFQLQIDWISQISYLLTSPGFQILWNGALIDSVYDNSCTLKTSTYYLTTISGVNQLVVGGIGLIDSQGILVRNVRFRQLIYANITTNSTATNTTSTNYTQNTTSITNQTNTTLNTTNSSSSTSQNTSTDTNSSNLTETSNSTLNSTSNATDSSSNSANTANLTETTNSTAEPTTNNTSTTNSTTSNTTNSTQTNNATSNSTDSTLPQNSTSNNTSSSNSSSNIPHMPTAGDYSFDALQKIINGSQYDGIYRMMYFVQNFQLTRLVITLTALKQNAKFLFGFMLEFNHLILYNYHLLNYTLMSNIILTIMMTLDDQKGYILDKYIYPFLGTSPQDIVSEFELQNDLPTNINNIVSDLMQRPNGVMLEYTDILCVDLPVMLVMFALGYLGFKLLFRWRISVIFRQYSLLGCFLFMFLEGKIEIVTFYFLSELLLLVNARFEQKLKTTAILVAYFLIFVTAVGGMLIFKAKYKKLIKYVYDNCKQPQQECLHVTFGFGLYNIILGFTHRILLNYPLPQLYLLILIQAVYFIYLTTHLFQRRYESIPLGAILISMNLVRLAFISTFLYFELFPDSEYELSIIQQYFLYSFLLLWGLSSVVALLEKMVTIFKILFRECRQHNQRNKITPSQTVEQHIEPSKTEEPDRQAFYSQRSCANRIKTKIVIVNDENEEITVSFSKGGFRRAKTRVHVTSEPMEYRPHVTAVTKRLKRMHYVNNQKVTFNTLK